MTKHSVSLYIDESVIRLLVSDRKGVRVCASAELEPNLINSMVVADKPKLASRISQLLKNHEIKTGSLDLVISASQVLTRPILLPALPKNLLHEAVVREAKRVLPLSLDQVYLSYQSAPAHNGKMRVFLAALRRESVDSIIDTMKIAKIKVASLTIKPLAIARLVKTDGIIVDVRKNEFDIVICIDKLPHPVRSVAFPAANLTTAAMMSVVLDEIDRTIAFYNNGSPDAKLPPALPMFIGGELLRQKTLQQQLTERFGFPVVELDSPVTFPENCNSADFLANAAVNTTEKSGLMGVSPNAMNFNLLPAEHRPPPVKWGNVAIVPAVIALLVVTVALFALAGVTSKNIAARQQQLESTSRQLQKMQAEKTSVRNDIRTLQSQLDQVNSDIDTIQSYSAALDNRGTNVNQSLQIINDGLTRNMVFNSIAMTDNTVTITGSCLDSSLVMQYAQALSDSNNFKGVLISSNIQDASSKIWTFSIILKE